MAIIAVIQQKGGVGKSTITANLAGELASSGRSVRVLDLDPQLSLANWSRLGLVEDQALRLRIVDGVRLLFDMQVAGLL